MSGSAPRVLDVERLDAAADAAVGALRLDLDAVRLRARAARRARVRRWTALAAATVAASVLAAAVAAGAGPLRTAPPVPAQNPAGPGALPDRIHLPPRTPWSVTDRPISRVGVVLAGDLDVPAPDGSRFEGTAPVLVGADRGEYRRLPAGGVGALSVSADGGTVAWADRLPPVDEGFGPDLAGVVRWVDVSSGATGSATFPYPRDLVPAVERTWVSGDGTSLLVEVLISVRAGDLSERRPVLWSVDPRTSQPTNLCDCSVYEAAFAGGRLFVEPDDPAAFDRLALRTGAARLQAPRDSLTAPSGWTFGQPPAFVSADGARRLVLDTPENPDGAVTDWWVAAVDNSGRTRDRQAVGEAVHVHPLAWDGRTAWLAVSTVSQGSRTVAVDLTTGEQRTVMARSGAAVDLSGGRPLPHVTAVAADVAAGGRTAQFPPPDDGVGTWSADGLRLLWLSTGRVLVGAVLAFALGAAVLLGLRLLGRHLAATR